MKPALTLPLALAGLIIIPAADAKPRTCRSGHTVYKHNGVRVFEDGGFDGEWFACGKRSRRPVPLYSSEAGYGVLRVLGRSGDKVLFHASFSGEGGGQQTTLGWFDARTSQVRSGDLAGEAGNDVRDVVVTRAGALGVVASADEEIGTRIGYLAPSPRKRVLLRERVLSLAGARYAERSLAFADGARSLAWKLADGRARSVPVTGEAFTCTSGTTVVENAGGRVFESFPNPREDVLAVCTRGATTPRRLAVSDVTHQDHWEPRSIVRAGSRVAFVAGGTGIGVLDEAAGELQFTEPKDIRYVQAAGIGSAGPPAFAADTSDGQHVIARLTAEGWERLAVQGGELTNAESFRVGDDGRVTWWTQKGEQSTPLAGVTTIDCATGTTLLGKDGLRVFEVLPAGTTDARLLACAPGAAAPVALRTGPRTADWSVGELARGNDRVAIVAYASGVGDHAISFGAAPDSVRVGERATIEGVIAGSAVAADGRVALARHAGNRWTITGFGLGGPGALRRERILAKPKDGVRAGTLAFSPDANRIIWESRAGAARSATGP